MLIYWVSCRGEYCAPISAQTMTEICREAESAILHTVLFDELRQEIKTVAPPADLSSTTGAQHDSLVPRLLPTAQLATLFTLKLQHLRICFQCFSCAYYNDTFAVLLFAY